MQRLFFPWIVRTNAATRELTKGCAASRTQEARRGICAAIGCGFFAPTRRIPTSVDDTHNEAGAHKGERIQPITRQVAQSRAAAANKQAFKNRPLSRLGVEALVTLRLVFIQTNHVQGAGVTSNSVEEPREENLGALQEVLSSPRRLGLSVVVVVLLSLAGWAAIGFAATSLIP